MIIMAGPGPLRPGLCRGVTPSTVVGCPALTAAWEAAAAAASSGGSAERRLDANVAVCQVP